MFNLDWDEANLAHIALRVVSADEAEQAVESALLELDTYVIDDEERVEELALRMAGVS